MELMDKQVVLTEYADRLERIYHELEALRKTLDMNGSHAYGVMLSQLRWSVAGKLRELAK